MIIISSAKDCDQHTLESWREKHIAKHFQSALTFEVGSESSDSPNPDQSSDIFETCNSSGITFLVTDSAEEATQFCREGGRVLLIDIARAYDSLKQEWSGCPDFVVVDGWSTFHNSFSALESRSARELTAHAVEAAVEFLRTKTPVKAESDCLEVCCGTGDIALALHTHPRYLLASDPSPRKIRSLRNKIKQNTKILNIEAQFLLHKDLHTISRRFDLIYAFPEPSDTFLNAETVCAVSSLLKPGGCLTVITKDDKPVDKNMVLSWMKAAHLESIATERLDKDHLLATSARMPFPPAGSEFPSAEDAAEEDTVDGPAADALGSKRTVGHDGSSSKGLSPAKRAKA